MTSAATSMGNGGRTNGTEVGGAARARPTTVLSPATPSSWAHADEATHRASSVPATLRLSDAQVGYVYDMQMMMHSCIHGHPEQPERIRRIHDELKLASCLSKMRQLPIRPAEREEVLLVHSEGLWDKVMAISSMTEQDIADSEAYYNDLSLYVHSNTPASARLSCGGVIEASLAVARGEVKKSFAIVRPPGHHSEPDEHMGFCFFNNVAIAARVVQQLTPIKKILILDWDVHHGNGTQHAFNDDPSVLYISIHRYDGGNFYPNGPFGSMVSCGEGKGLGYSVNIPWPEKGMGDADYLHAFQSIVMPIAMEFAPELVIVSAGFDAADGDDLGECHVTPGGYAHMTHMLSGLANGKMIVALEGGYCLDAIAASSLAVAKVILGEAPPELPPLVASQIATETVWQVAIEQSKYWHNVNPKACEPIDEMEPISFSIPELLKAHRQEYLFRTHRMLSVPFVSQALEERFATQVTCTSDIMTNDTLVVFVHEFGNLRAELDSVVSCDLRVEHSYMVDFSKQLIGWVKETGHALLDVNVFPKAFVSTVKGKSGKENHAGDAMTYLWDNYIQLSDARRVVLIGHGPGCEAVMHLIHHRTAGVMGCVDAVVQVVGNHNVPATPRDAADIRRWYAERSAVFVPIQHRIFRESKILQKHGNIMPVDEPKPIKLIIKALPAIREFVEPRIDAGKKAAAKTR